MSATETRGSGSDLPSHAAWRGNWAATSSFKAVPEVEAGLLLFYPESSSSGGPSTSHQADSPRSQSAKGRLLIVEDDGPSRSALRALLSREGWEVVTSVTIAEARAAIAAAAPDVVLLDLMLPDGDGAAILSAVRAQNLATRVVVITGVGDPARIERVRQLGPQSILFKPIQMSELLNTIQ
ncbi:MAG TPA: response regulator [Humisphaera sp.]|jgi:CheY-like chemotaxis protein|nr:response regulator [Humisphaera sp.]